MTKTRLIQVERKKDAEHWCAVQVWEGGDETGPFERFELGDPVHTKQPFLDQEYNRDRIWWIARITDSGGDDGVQVWLNFERYGGHGDTSVSPTELRHMNAMERLALEYSSE